MQKTATHYLDDLNSAQRSAVEFGITAGQPDEISGPLLIIAGAGTGKTNTLAYRVAHLILNGSDPRRILLLTFTRRAAAEMTRRAERIIAHVTDAATGGRGDHSHATRVEWSGTFHATANRLLRIYADAAEMDGDFTVMDRSDSADLMNLIRNDLGLARQQRRFPRKSTCLAIYSHTVNCQCPIEQSLNDHFPWCDEWAQELRSLFGAYAERKQENNVLDYDDLLLCWSYLIEDPVLAADIGGRFDHVLVDEYQDTNTLQAAILMGMKPDGHGLTIVGDDAQSIYSFRSATVRNIIEFPSHFDPPGKVITLEQNYRSTQTILDACNAVINLAGTRFTKNLFGDKASRQRPILATVEDETCQVNYVVEAVLRNREEGLDLRQQAVLFRTGHHSGPLEIELGRRNIPYVKYGGLKFLEASHVKDLICVLRWVENPRDTVAAFRVLQILPGIGPATADRAIRHLHAHDLDLRAMATFEAPPAAAAEWPVLAAMLAALCDIDTDWRGQIGLARTWYSPHLMRLYDSPRVRDLDLEQLEAITANYPSRERFLSDLALDPPSMTGDFSGPPMLDEDFLILSTIHSAKGQEWDAVFILNASDACIPSDMATGKTDQIDEERRLLYVAMTRAKEQLHVIHPFRFFTRHQERYGDRHIYAPRTRFIPDDLLGFFERRTHGRDQGRDGSHAVTAGGARVDVRARAKKMWQ